MKLTDNADTLAKQAQALRDRLDHRPRANPERMLAIMEQKDSTTQLINGIACASDCEVCGGSGMIRYAMPDGAPLPIDHPKFGKMFPCPNLPINSPIYNESGLTPTERAYDWKQLKHRKGDAEKSLHEAVDAVKKAMRDQRGVVILYGGNGLAKSLILKIAVAETLRERRGVMARYIHMSEIIEDLRASYDTEAPGASLRALEQRYAKYPLLCIDELGVERATDFSDEKTFFLIDRRYTAAIENQAPLITILATNNSIKDFPARIADRLMDGRCAQVKLLGESMRPAMRQEELPITNKE